MTFKDMDEQALIHHARNGDLDAFNSLVLAYQDRIYHQAYRMLSDPVVAADATQDAFISAYRKLNTYRGGSFLAWLLRIVTNACYDELRRRKRHPTVPLEPKDNENQEIESPRWMVDPGESPEEAAERLELGRAIQHCLIRLAPDFRAVAILVDIQGLDYQAAAQVLGCALGTVKSRLARARLSIQDCMRGFQELLPTIFRLRDEGVI
jgi:RNA polymerase sigma-70 factor (ECF subfamily)